MLANVPQMGQTYLYGIREWTVIQTNEKFTTLESAGCPGWTLPTDTVVKCFAEITPGLKLRGPIQLASAIAEIPVLVYKDSALLLTVEELRLVVEIVNSALANGSR